MKESYNAAPKIQAQVTPAVSTFKGRTVWARSRSPALYPTFLFFQMNIYTFLDEELARKRAGESATTIQETQKSTRQDDTRISRGAQERSRVGGYKELSSKQLRLASCMTCLHCFQSAHRSNLPACSSRA